MILFSSASLNLFYKTLGKLLLPLLFLMQSCTSIELSDIQGETKHFFGYTKIEAPLVEENVFAIKIDTLGIASGESLSIGWSSNEQIAVPLQQSENKRLGFEAPCSLVVIIRSRAEAAQIQNILNDLDGVNLCSVKFQ